MAAGREIRLRICGIQYPPRIVGGTRDENTVQPVVTMQEVVASYYCRAGAHYLFYEEQPEGFEQAFRTRVKRRGKQLEIDRQGTAGGRMVFVPGKTWRTEYATPFGRLLFDIVTKTVEIAPDKSFSKDSREDMDDDAQDWRNVKIKYTLENQGESLGEYELYIETI